MSAELLRLVRFGLVGVTNSLLTLATFAVLTGYGVPPPAASALAFAIGAANGYHLNRRWTFRVVHRGPAVLLRYVAVQAMGAGLSAVGVALASDLSLAHMAAEALVLPCVAVITYRLSRMLVFGATELTA